MPIDESDILNNFSLNGGYDSSYRSDVLDADVVERYYHIKEDHVDGTRRLSLSAACISEHGFDPATAMPPYAGIADYSDGKYESTNDPDDPHVALLEIWRPFDERRFPDHVIADSSKAPEWKRGDTIMQYAELTREELVLLGEACLRLAEDLTPAVEEEEETP